MLLDLYIALMLDKVYPTGLELAEFFGKMQSRGYSIKYTIKRVCKRYRLWRFSDVSLDQLNKFFDDIAKPKIAS